MSEKAKRLAELITENKELAGKAGNDEEAAKQYALNLAEAKELKGKLQQENEMAEVEEWAAKTKGVLPLTSGKAGVDGFVPDGTAEVDTSGSTQEVKDGKVITKYDLKFYDDNPLMDQKTYEIISSPEYKMAFKQYMREGRDAMSRDTLKTLQEGVDTSGGFLVPEEILAAIISKAPTPTGVSGRVRQLQTMRDNLVVPRVNYTTDDLYTTGIRVTWTGESPASATSARVTEPVFGQTRIPVYTAMLSMPITNDMIEDAAFPIVSWASNKFSETIDLLKDNMTLNGSGIGQPSGILKNPGATGEPAVVTSGQASTFTADALETLAFTLPPQYDNGAAYIFNKLSTAKLIASLKDGQGRYLWGSGLQDSGMVPGWKDRKLWGYDVSYSEFMPNVGTSTYPIIFGDPTGYYNLNRVGFSIQVLREVYAETNQIVLLGRIRFGGQVAEDWKLKILQCHV